MLSLSLATTVEVHNNYLLARGGGGGGGLGKVTLLFPTFVSLTHSACHYDVPQKRARASGRLCKFVRDTTVIRTSEVEEKLRS